MIELQPATPAEIEALVEAVDLRGLPADVQPVAVFDADETLWRGDVGEDLFGWFAAEGLVHHALDDRIRAELRRFGVPVGEDVQAGMRTFFEEYMEGRHHGVPEYEFMVWCMAGHREGDVRRWAAERIDAYLPGRPFEFQREIIRRLERKGVACYVISASNRWSVEAGARFMGLDVSRSRGVDLVRTGDGLTGALIRPAPVGPGKADVMSTLFEGRALFGFGDSMFDIPMLKRSLYPVMINPKAKVRDALTRETGQGWRELSLP